MEENQQNKQTEETSGSGPETTVTSSVSPEEQERLRIQEEEATAERAKKFADYLKHLDLDSAAEDSPILDVKYDNGTHGHGRTVIILGQFALHARMTGEQSGKMWNDNLGINQEQEVNFDVCITILREQINGVLMQRKEIDWSIVPDAPPEDEREQFAYNLDIIHGFGNIQLQGLTREVAIKYKKTIYGWRTYCNSQFMNMIRIIPQQP